MPSKNCAKNLHACQWERDIFFFIALLFIVGNLAQLVYVFRDKLIRLVRRGAGRLPVPDDEDPIVNIRD